jgi:hypothetical protein
MSVLAENLVLHQGEDFSNNFIIRNPDKSLVDISSYSAYGYMAKFPESKEKIEFNVGIITSTSEIKISIASTITGKIPHGRHYYNLFTVSNNITKKEREGELLVQPSVL